MKQPQWVLKAQREAGAYGHSNRATWLNEWSVDVWQSPEFNAYEYDGRLILSRTVELKRAYVSRLRSEVEDLAAWVKESEARVNECLRKMVEGAE